MPSGGADSDDRPGSALAAGDPGIFAANAGATGSVGQSGSGCAVRPSTNPRYLALLRVDAQALRRGHVAGEELCEIAGVGPVPVSVARDLLGEAILKLVITNGVDVANVTHLGRGPTAAQRTALLWANPRCSVQGCDRRRIEYDHQKPWADTKHTRLDELDPLCGFHHDLKTRLGYALVAGKGKRAFVAPDDPRHPRYREPSGNRSRSGGDAGEPTEARRNSSGGAASASDRSAAAAGPNGRSGRQRPGAVMDGDGIRRPRDTRRAQSAGQPQPGRTSPSRQDHPRRHGCSPLVLTVTRASSPSGSASVTPNHKGLIAASRERQGQLGSKPIAGSGSGAGSVRRQRGVEIDADAVGIADGGVPLAPRRVERCEVGPGAEGR